MLSGEGSASSIMLLGSTYTQRQSTFLRQLQYDGGVLSNAHAASAVTTVGPEKLVSPEQLASGYCTFEIKLFWQSHPFEGRPLPLGRHPQLWTQLAALQQLLPQLPCRRPPSGRH